MHFLVIFSYVFHSERLLVQVNVEYQLCIKRGRSNMSVYVLLNYQTNWERGEMQALPCI